MNGIVATLIYLLKHSKTDTSGALILALCI